eukprot:1338268-Amphidinium_carterae.1
MSSDPSDVVISQMTDPPEVCPPCDTPLAPILGAPFEPYQVPLNPRVLFPRVVLVFPLHLTVV